MPTDPAPLPALRLGALFARRPFQFGLRGDAYLWTEMGEFFVDTPLPPSVWDVRSQLEKAWETAVDQRLTDSSDPIYIPRFNPGHGMSAGSVVPRWWRDTGIPILIDRYEGIMSDAPV